MVPTKALICAPFIVNVESDCVLKEQEWKPIGEFWDISYGAMYLYNDIITIGMDFLSDTSAEKEWTDNGHQMYYSRKLNHTVITKKINGFSSECILWKIIDNKYYISNKNKIYIYNIAEKEIEEVLTIPEKGGLTWLTIRGENLYCIMKCNKEKELFFRYDSSEKKFEEIQVCKPENIISFTDEMIVLEKNKVRGFEISDNGIGELMWCVSLKTPQWGCKYKAEQAGNWIFIYEYGLERDTLIGKINLLTREIEYIE